MSIMIHNEHNEPPTDSQRTPIVAPPTRTSVSHTISHWLTHSRTLHPSSLHENRTPIFEACLAVNKRR